MKPLKHGHSKKAPRLKVGARGNPRISIGGLGRAGPHQSAASSGAAPIDIDAEANRLAPYMAAYPCPSAAELRQDRDEWQALGLKTIGRDTDRSQPELCRARNSVLGRRSQDGQSELPLRAYFGLALECRLSPTLPVFPEATLVGALSARLRRPRMRSATSAIRVRREKAALSSGCEPHPAKRSSRKQPEQSWR